MVNSAEWVESIPSFRKVLPISKTRSIPPTSARFRYSSVAIRSDIGWSNAFRWV